MKVRFDMLEFPPTSQGIESGASLEGKLFTGTAYDKDEESYMEYTYLNGDAHGRWHTESIKTRRLLSEGYYEHGREHGEFREWSNTGILCEHAKYNQGILTFRKRWNDDLVLIQHYDVTQKIDKKFYDSGELGWSRSDHHVSYFLKNGERLAKKMEYDESERRYLWEFDVPVILRTISQLDSAYHHHVITWFCRYLLENDEPVALTFLCDLTHHTNAYFRGTAIQFLSELKRREAGLHLKKLMDDQEISSVEGKFDEGYISHSQTNAERARAALVLLS